MKIEQNAKNLFDTVMREEGIESDAEMSRRLDILPSQLCNIRAGRVKLGPTVIVRMMEAFPISLARIKKLLSEDE